MDNVLAYIYKASGDRLTDDARDVLGIELCHKAVPVCLYCLKTDVKLTCYLACRIFVDDEVEDFHLALCVVGVPWSKRMCSHRYRNYQVFFNNVKIVSIIHPYNHMIM